MGAQLPLYYLKSFLGQQKLKNLTQVFTKNGQPISVQDKKINDTQR